MRQNNYKDERRRNWNSLIPNDLKEIGVNGGGTGRKRNGIGQWENIAGRMGLG